MAEAILKNKNISGLEVKSAGVFAMDGTPASSHTQKVLEEENIQHLHQSSALSQELVDWATYIITMTKGHKESVIGMFPEVSGKVFTLKEFADDDANGDIVDPFGGSLELYRKTYKDIDDSIIGMLRKLKL